MKRLLLIAIVLVFGLAGSALGGSAGFISKYDYIGSHAKRDLFLDTSNQLIYTGNGSWYGLGVYDYSDRTSITNVSVVDPSFDLTSSHTLSVNSIARYGDIIFCTGRTGSATYSKAAFVNSFEDGDADLSNGGTSFDSVLSTSAWDSGDAVGGTIAATESTIVKHGDYSCKATFSAQGHSCNVQEGITGDAENEAIFWVYIPQGGAVDGGVARQHVFSDNSGADWCCRVIYKSVDTDGTIYLQLRLEYLYSGDTTQAVNGTTNLDWNTWYQIRVRYKIDGSVGGASIEYRENIHDNWTTECSNYTRDTTGYTPDALGVGIWYNDAEWTSGSFYYDEVYYDDEFDMPNYRDEGRLSVVDVSIPATPTYKTCFDVEAKLSGISIDETNEIAYLGCQKVGVMAIDISDFSDGWDVGDKLRILSHYYKTEGDNPGDGNWDAHHMILSDDNDHLIVAAGSTAIVSLDVSDPTSMTLADTLDYTTGNEELPWGIERHPTNPDIAYVATRVDRLSKTIYPAASSEADDSGLWVINISDPTSITSTVLVELPTVGADDLKSNHPGSDDFDDPCPQMMAVDGNYCYLANGYRGVAVFDISTPTLPVFSHWYNEATDTPYVTGIDVVDGVVVAGAHNVGGADESDVYLFYDWPSETANVSQSGSGSMSGLDIDNSMQISDLNAMLDLVALPILFNCQGGTFSTAFNPSTPGDSGSVATLSRGIFPNLVLDQNYWTIKNCISVDAPADAMLVTGTNNSILNCTIYNSTGDGIDHNEDVIITNVILESIGGTSIVATGGTATSTTNWLDDAADPLFVDPSNGDFHLMAGSPCINAGYLWPVDGDGDQYSPNGTLIWNDTTDLPVGHWLDGVEIGAWPFPSNATETFYVSANGDASDPETIAGAFDASDFNTAGNWDTDDSDDGKIGPNDTVIILDDDGEIKTVLQAQQPGLEGYPITIKGESATEHPIIWGIDGNELDYLVIEDLDVLGSVIVDGENCFVRRVKNAQSFDGSDSGSMTFVTSGQTIDGDSTVSGTPDVLWVWEDGTTNTNADPVAYDYGTAAVRQFSYNISDASLLTEIDLHDQNLLGSIPDLSSNIALTQFNCRTNSLTGSIPDLSNNTSLTHFFCYANSLTGSIPDLSSNTALIYFYCYTNSLTGSIPDLSSNTALVRFYCDDNSLTGSIPDLSSNIALVRFYCNSNSLTGSIPDLSNNTSLTHFFCYANSAMTGVEFTSLPANLLTFRADDCNFSASDVETILCALDTAGGVSGTVNVSGNTAPTAAGTTCAGNLTGKGWSVTTD